MFALLERYRFAFQASYDALAWLLGMALATWARYEFELSAVNTAGVLLIGLVAAAIQIGIGSWRGLYRHRWRYGTFEEIATMCQTVAMVTPVVALLNRFVLGHRVPVSATFMSGALAACFMAAGRLSFRAVNDRRSLPGRSGPTEPVIVFGAGDGGHRIVRAMLSDPSSPYLPAALLDDDPALRRFCIKNVTVEGDRSNLASTAQRHGARSVVIAIPSASGEVVRELAKLAGEAGLRVLVLPAVADLLNGVEVGDIRPLTEADLLGRREIETDLESVAGYISDKRVLVTGAGGSIGSELCRRLVRFEPECLMMLDRDESGLHATQLSIEGAAFSDCGSLVLADIRDRARIFEVFEAIRPQVVFHAAALKHLPILESNPDEGIKTNVWGTKHLLDAAVRVEVERFINISTDKAADPSSVLGRTKRVAERLTARTGIDNGGTYLSVRFGNVLGSRGSVLPLFETQIARGGPLTVTDPEVTRYFMTVPEACELVIQAGALGTTAEVMVLDMGHPVRIDEVARRLIAQSGENIEIRYTGLRPGEKLHEVLFAGDESPRSSAHPLISVVDAPPLNSVAFDAEMDGAVIDLRQWTSSAGATLGAPDGRSGDADRPVIANETT